MGRSASSSTKRRSLSIEVYLSLSILMAVFPGGTGLASTRMSPFWILLERRVMEVVMTNWSYNMCKAPVKSSPPTNQHPTLYTGRMPFLLSNPLSKHWGKRLDAEGKSRVQPADTGSPKKHLLEYCACVCACMWRLSNSWNKSYDVHDDEVSGVKPLTQISQSHPNTVCGLDFNAMKTFDSKPVLAPTVQRAHCLCLYEDTSPPMKFRRTWSGHKKTVCGSIYLQPGQTDLN